MDGDLSQSHLSQEALLQPVRDMGHSEILRGHFWGTQPFEKGLGFPHRVPDLRGWEDMRLRGQVRAGDLLGREHSHKTIGFTVLTSMLQYRQSVSKVTHP